MRTEATGPHVREGIPPGFSYDFSRRGFRYFSTRASNSSWDFAIVSNGKTYKNINKSARIKKLEKKEDQAEA